MKVFYQKCNIWLKTYKNLAYILGVSFKFCPLGIVAGVISKILLEIKAYILSVFSVSWIIKSIETEKNISEIFVDFTGYIIICFVCIIYDILYTKLIQPITKSKLDYYLIEMLNEKVSNIGIESYENNLFNDNIEIVLSSIPKKLDDCLNNIYVLIGRIVSLSLIGVTIIKTNAISLIFVFVTIIIYYIVKRKSNSLRYKYNQETMSSERRKKYVKKVYSDRSSAQDIRLTKISKVLEQIYNESNEYILGKIKYFGKKISLFRSIQNSAVTFFSFFSTVIYSTICVLMSNMPISNFVILINANTKMSTKMMELFSNMCAFDDFSIYIDKMKELMNYQCSIYNTLSLENTPIFKSTICFENVYYRYSSSDKMTLTNISFTIKKGEKIAIIGRNGTGKTTLINLLLRLSDPIFGVIKLDGIDIKNFSPIKYRQLYSVMLQEINFYPITVKEFISGKEISEMGDEVSIDKSIEFSELSYKFDNHTNGYDTILSKEFDKNGVVFSGGECQRLGLARTYFNNADIILLDEPSSALDPISELELMKKIFHFWNEKTIIYISHNLSTTKYADRIIFLSNGTVDAIGSHEQLLSNCPDYANMYKLQKDFYI